MFAGIYLLGSAGACLCCFIEVVATASQYSPVSRKSVFLSLLESSAILSSEGTPNAFKLGKYFKVEFCKTAVIVLLFLLNMLT